MYKTEHRLHEKKRTRVVHAIKEKEKICGCKKKIKRNE
jgi:hypothetical protein